MFGKKTQVPFKFRFDNPVTYTCTWVMPIDGKTWERILERSLTKLKRKGLITAQNINRQEDLEKFEVSKEFVPQVKLALNSGMRQAIDFCEKQGVIIIDWSVKSCTFTKTLEGWESKVVVSGSWSR
jgi:hypothetical protein